MTRSPLDRLPINAALIVKNTPRATGVSSAEPESFIRGAEAMHTIVPYPVETLVTHKYPLDQVSDAFRTHETLDAMVAVVTPNR